MESEKTVQFVEFVKKWKVVIIAVILSIVALFVLVVTIKRISVKNQLENYYTTECKLEDVKITLKKSSSKYYDYYAYVECSNMSDFTYEELTRFAYYLDVDDVDVLNFKCDGDTYRIDTTSVYKNGEEVYKKATHKCVECGFGAMYQYKSSITGQTEWYCHSCYRELQDLLNKFGID